MGNSRVIQRDKKWQHYPEFGWRWNKSHLQIVQQILQVHFTQFKEEGEQGWTAISAYLCVYRHTVVTWKRQHHSKLMRSWMRWHKWLPDKDGLNWCSVITEPIMLEQHMRLRSRWRPWIKRKLKDWLPTRESIGCSIHQEHCTLVGF